MTSLFHFSYAKESKLTSTKAKGVINSIDNQVLTNMLYNEIAFEQKYLTGTRIAQRGTAHEQKYLTGT